MELPGGAGNENGVQDHGIALASQDDENRPSVIGRPSILAKRLRHGAIRRNHLAPALGTSSLNLTASDTAYLSADASALYPDTVRTRFVGTGRCSDTRKISSREQPLPLFQV